MSDNDQQIIAESKVENCPNKEGCNEWLITNTRFEYAWKYFEYHAKQRTTMLNFGLIFVGLFLNAYIGLIKSDLIWIAAGLSFLGAWITIIFIFLDRRNEELVFIAADVLFKIENDTLFKAGTFNDQIKNWPKRRNYFWGWEEPTDASHGDNVNLGIFVRQKFDEDKFKKSKYTHGKLIQYLYITVLILFFALGILPIGGILLT